MILDLDYSGYVCVDLCINKIVRLKSYYVGVNNIVL